MVDGRDRRAFAARGHVAPPELADDREAQRPGERAAIAELDAQPVARPVQDGLPVEPDGPDVVSRVGSKHAARRLDMGERHGVGEVRGRRRMAHHGREPSAKHRLERERLCRAMFENVRAVSVQQRDIDRVERRAAHHAEIPMRRLRRAFRLRHPYAAGARGAVPTIMTSRQCIRPHLDRSFLFGCGDDADNRDFLR